MDRDIAVDTEPQTSAPELGWLVLASALLERELVVSRTGQSTTAADLAVQRAEDIYDVALDEGAFAELVVAAALDPDSARLLALCCAVEIDGRLQRIAAVLNDGGNNDRLDVATTVRLLGITTLESLAPDGPLSRAALIELADGTPLARTQIAVPRVVLWALLGNSSLDPELQPDARIVLTPPGRLGTEELVIVNGEDRLRRTQAAVLSTARAAFLVVDQPHSELGWRTIVRQAGVAGFGVIIHLDSALDAEGRRWIERADHLAWALCGRDPMPLDCLPDGDFVEISAGDPVVTGAEWSATFPDTPVPARRPTAEQLQLAQRVAQPGGDPQESIRRVASGTLLAHAKRVVPQIGWDELILPPLQERQLRDLVDRYRNRGVVHDDWGLPLFPSPGVVALFSGPSGTGKTTTAEVIAHDLGVDMFRVDLSAITSKYIGETEKNLEEIFSAAHACDYLLLFDEADALFGSRSQVSDARDRYANMEVSYLLQRLETYDGFVILTSNFQGNIDRAFLRRIHATVYFPVPDPADRERIWDRCLARAPREALELDFVAEKFEFSGGSIRNAALTAAFLAAGSGTPIAMPHLLRAASQEMSKLGQRPLSDQFGRWAADLVDVG